MKVLSLVTRMGLLALGMILVSVLSADAVWADASEDEPTTSGLADALLTDWALPLLILGVLMVVPPLLLLYTSLILEGETELLIVGMIHAFVAGGVGFQGLNRGVFAQMVPKGREAEFFGVYFVLIKAFSWVGPLACAVLNEATGSLRTAILSALIFYIPAILVLATTDFDEAQREAEAASHTPRVKGGRPSGAQRGGALNAGPHERLLPPTATYGTTSSCPPVPSAFSEVA